MQTRTIKALAQVYQEEGLPVLNAPHAGEARAVEQSGTVGYVASLQAARKVPRRAKAPRPGAEGTAIAQAALPE